MATEIKVRLNFDAGNAPSSAAQVAKGLDDVGKSAQAAAVQQQVFIQSLQEQVATQGMTEEQLLRYKAQQLGVGDQADHLISKLHQTGQAGQISAAQMSAAMRTVPAQMTDIVTQLQGGASPLTILLQQGGQMKDSFGGIRPMMQGLLSTITPVAVGVTAVAAAVGLLGYEIYAGHNESETLKKSFAATGGQAGVTLGQITGLSRGIADSGVVTIGVAREITSALVETGKFSGGALSSAAGAAASLGRVTGQSAGDIAKDFAGMADGAAAWAIKANKSYAFLTAAQVQHIRELESQGKSTEAMQATTDALKVAMDQRLTPAVGTLERAWVSTKAATSSFMDSLKDIGREETAEDRIKSLSKQLKELEEFRAKGGRKGLFGEKIDDGSEEAAAVRQKLDAEQKVADASQAAAAKKAADAREEQRKIEEGSKGHVDAVLALERAGDAVRLAGAQAGIDQRLQAAALGYRSGLTGAQDYTTQLMAIEHQKGSLQESQIQRQMEIERRRITENPRDVLAQKTAIAQLEAQAITVRAQNTVAQRELLRSIQSSQDGLDMAQMQAHSDDAVRAIDAAAAQMDAMQRAGLVTSEEVANAKIDFERAKLAQQSQLIDAQIAQEERRQNAGTAAIDSATKLASLQSQKAGIQARIDLTVTAEGGAQAERDLSKSRDDAQAWAASWQSADQQVRSLQQSNAAARAALITDPVERAKAETAIQIAQIGRAAQDMSRDLSLRLSLTSDPAQQEALKERITTLASETAQSIELVNAGLADKLKPSWKAMLDGWADTNRLMRDSHDEMMSGVVKNSEDSFVEVVKTGKTSAKAIGDSLVEQMARASFRKLLSSDAGQGVMGGISSLLPGAAATGGVVKSVQPGVAGISGGFVGGLGGAGSAIQSAQTAQIGSGGAQDAARSIAQAGRSAEQLGSNAATSAQALTEQSQSALQSGAAQQALTTVNQASQAVETQGAAEKAVVDTTVGAALKELGASAIEAAIQLKLAGSMSGAGGGGGVPMPSAVGHVFSDAQRFAVGASFTNQIVTASTFFKFRSSGVTKLGEMGEAGPEAIMPLDKVGGSLGLGVVDETGRPMPTALRLARGRGGRLSAVLDTAAALASLHASGHGTARQAAITIAEQQRQAKFEFGGSFATPMALSGLSGSPHKFAVGDMFGSQVSPMVISGAAASSGRSSGGSSSGTSSGAGPTDSPAAATSISYTGGPIHIDARSDQAQIAQMVMQAQQQERKALMAELKARGVLR